MRSYTIYDARDLARASEDGRWHWFDRDTMRFFGSRILPVKGRVFVTSELPPHAPRTYSVRVMLDNAAIEGEIVFFQSRANARRQAEALARWLIEGGVDLFHLDLPRPADMPSNGNGLPPDWRGRPVSDWRPNDSDWAGDTRPASEACK